MGTIPSPLPPCDNLGCSDIICCPGKQSWPELIGMEAEEAKSIIESENPNVTVVISTPDVYRIPDLCCNIVWIYVEDLSNGIVTNVPKVGCSGA
ncbi:PREDICTED: inhibitor of trypsin and hageman factor-like [Nelumbo nucifera]|uniref:Inhibitor of trypsin and hageman factor-like n=2 Tax=Nelumbo nucifera TaxID=4432 RepID=A0A1U7Z927_NELNU|nr:PREDICTED: inhibitor of trypsin and hageman factor-like [Nelumbo nucifera]DAD24984.1 TPA_asm: hypothetical protein HUJ06_026448 [Nelumbo nucifera]